MLVLNKFRRGGLKFLVFSDYNGGTLINMGEDLYGKK